MCNHPAYKSATLFKISNKGLCAVQQYFNPVTKCTYWGPIARWLNDKLYLHDGFKKFFDARADIVHDGFYPTVTIRQIMWALKMKPLKRERWETAFDRRII